MKEYEKLFEIENGRDHFVKLKYSTRYLELDDFTEVVPENAYIVRVVEIKHFESEEKLKQYLKENEKRIKRKGYNYEVGEINYSKDIKKHKFVLNHEREIDLDNIYVDKILHDVVEGEFYL